MKNFSNDIANSMNSYLNDPSNYSLYGYNGINKQASAEEAPSEHSVELNDELLPELDEPVAPVVAEKDSRQLVKSAYNSLMQASADLDDAGFGKLSANALVLVNHLIVEAKKNVAEKERDRETVKAKSEKVSEKTKLKKEKAHAKSEREKLQAKMEKAKNDARDKKSLNDAKSRKDKEMNAAKDRFDKEKARIEKSRKR